MIIETPFLLSLFDVAERFPAQHFSDMVSLIDPSMSTDTPRLSGFVWQLCCSTSFILLFPCVRLPKDENQGQNENTWRFNVAGKKKENKNKNLPFLPTRSF